MATPPTLTGIERTFEEGQVIVTKTDLKGHITYANDVFQRASEVSERDSLGQPHSFIRHPDMPRCIFKLLWQTIQGGREVFAYVVNRATNGDHYWVYAHVTPSFDAQGEIVGYHSNRREPDRKILTDHIIPLYKSLRDEEQRHTNRKSGLEASWAMLQSHLEQAGMEYDEFICTLGQGQRRGYR